MDIIGWLHDDWLLWFVQDMFYALWPVSVAIMGLLLTGLPEHRLAMRLVAWLAVAWSLVCLACYGAITESPVLGCFLVIAIFYRGLRWVFWQVPAHVPAGTRPGRLQSLLPSSGWTTWLVRDYLRSDPRCVYWLDQARAIRGLPVTRTPVARRDCLLPSPELPHWRRTLWSALFAWLELRLRLFAVLPAYWKRPHQPLDLNEPHLRSVLRQEIEFSRQQMLRNWTADDFTDYCNRTPTERRRAGELAADYGRRYCLLREALTEYQTIRTPWKKGEVGLVHAARYCYETWQQRRHFDFLWFAPTPQTFGMRPDDKPGGEELPAVASRNTTDGDGEAMPDDRSENDGGSGTKHNGQCVAASAVSDAAESGEQSAMLDRELAGAAACVALLPADAEDAPDEMFQEAGAESVDEELLAAEGPAAGIVMHAEDRESQRKADLIWASAMLEAHLDVRAAIDGEFNIRPVEQLLGGAQTQLAAMMLLTIYCLRRDFTGPTAARRKLDLLIRLNERFGGPVDQLTKETAQLFRTMQIDVLMERGEYAQIREYFSDRDNLSPHEWKALADAEAAQAKHLTGQDALRDILRFDAISHYFHASFCGVWTMEYARVLLDHVETTENLVSLLRRHAVVIKEPETIALADERALRDKQAAPPRAAPIARLVLIVYSVANPGKRHRHVATKVPYTIGSGNGANLVMRVSQIAGVHIRLWEHRDGLAVSDISRTTGIRVNNGEAVAAAILKRGDRFQFAGVVIEVQEILRAAT